MLTGKTIILGVSSSVAAYKAAELTSALKKCGADIHVIMTKNACNFINPITFETLTGHKCLVDTFDRNFEFKVEHVELAKAADLAIVAPATANVCAKLAHGLADDMLTTTLLAFDKLKLIAPAMNTRMYDNPATQDNLAALRRYGWQIIEPEEGLLACGDVGKGKLASVEQLKESVINALLPKRDLAGRSILVTAGPTRERIDPVRYITNHSSGKMGYAIAKRAAARGAKVTLVSGPTNLPCPQGVTRVDIESAAELFRAVTERAAEQDMIVKAAAVADYRPAQTADEKISKGDGELSIALERTEDTLQYLGDHKKAGQILCGFAMETSQMEQKARRKLEKKHLDLICANNVKVAGAGFGVDTNVVTLIGRDGERCLGLKTKEEVADEILDELIRLYHAAHTADEE